MKYRLEHQLRRNDFLQLLLDASVQEKNNNNKLLNCQAKAANTTTVVLASDAKHNTANTTTGALANDASHNNKDHALATQSGDTTADATLTKHVMTLNEDVSDPAVVHKMNEVGTEVRSFNDGKVPTRDGNQSEINSQMTLATNESLHSSGDQKPSIDQEEWKLIDNKTHYNGNSNGKKEEYKYSKNNHNLAPTPADDKITTSTDVPPPGNFLC